ncbi:MAG: hypothetical protein CMC15_14395 [Flavobacteriaceae bacterium]|nr:hypothetical protein [Flavobacteriaceae bacterium]
MNIQSKKIPISQIQVDPNNPRILNKTKFKKLKSSIENFPEMLEVRPIVVADGIVVGGNMRLLAMKDLGFREVTAIDVTDWTQGQRDEFMIKDNLNYGDWDYDLLANEWEGTDLEDWGLDLWQEEKPKEEQKQRSIKINFNDDDYDTANELINALKNADTYIGGIVLDALRLQFK